MSQILENFFFFEVYAIQLMSEDLPATAKFIDRFPFRGSIRSHQRPLFLALIATVVLALYPLLAHAGAHHMCIYYISNDWYELRRRENKSNIFLDEKY